MNADIFVLFLSVFISVHPWFFLTRGPRGTLVVKTSFAGNAVALGRGLS